MGEWLKLPLDIQIFTNTTTYSSSQEHTPAAKNGNCSPYKSPTENASKA